MEEYNDIRDWLNADFCEARGIDEDRIKSLYTYAKKLDKALDKACDYIANIMPYEVNELVGVDYLYTKDKDKMKEHLLKESEKK